MTEAVLDKPAFVIGPRSWRWAEVIADARQRGDWDVLMDAARADLARLAAADAIGAGPSAADLEAACDEFRRERWLLSAEGTEAWLDEWGLSVDEWVQWIEHSLVRGDAAGEAADPPEPDPCVVERCAFVDAVCSGELERAARRLAIAVAAETGFDWVPAGVPPAPTPWPSHARLANQQAGEFPYVGQTAAMDCGVAALASICRFYGVAATTERVRALTSARGKMASMLDLTRAADALGFEASALRASKRRLDELALPAIVHVYGNHWAVLYELGASVASLCDPQRGLEQITRARFEAVWSGWIILVAPTERLQR